MVAFARGDHPGDEAVEGLEIVPFGEAVEVVRTYDEVDGRIRPPEVQHRLYRRDRTTLGDFKIADLDAGIVFKNTPEPFQPQLRRGMGPAFKRIDIGGHYVQRVDRQGLQRTLDDGNVPRMGRVERTAEDRYRHGPRFFNKIISKLG